MRVKNILLICLIIFLAAACSPGPDPELSAWIEQPEDGAQLPQLPINLHVVGQAHLGINEFDLYINGQLLDSFPPQQTGSTSGGPTKFFSAYLWSPPATGVFALAVRAHGGSGGISSLSQITIEIEPPTAQEASPLNAENQDLILIPSLPGPAFPYSLDQGKQFDSSPGYFPGEWEIATPLYPSFNIVSAELHTCDGQVYIMTEVKNNGPYYFQWIHFRVYHGGYTHSTYNWEDPWMFTGFDCPVPTSGQPSLGPGATAIIYFPITPINPYSEYDIRIHMCTFYSIPDPCPNASYFVS